LRIAFVLSKTIANQEFAMLQEVGCFGCLWGYGTIGAQARYGPTCTIEVITLTEKVSTLLVLVKHQQNNKRIVIRISRQVLIRLNLLECEH
jgi:hypothetical protein